jgi:hypothetical protein
MRPFFPIRMALNYMAGRHEGGHACCLLQILGTGCIDLVTLRNIHHKVPKSDFDRLVVAAGGIAAAKLFDCGPRHGGDLDLLQARPILERMPDGVGAWTRALARAEEICHQRMEFIGTVGDELERKQEIPGARIDALWQRYYRQAVPTATQQRYTYYGAVR